MGWFLPPHTHTLAHKYESNIACNNSSTPLGVPERGRRAWGQMRVAVIWPSVSMTQCTGDTWSASVREYVHVSLLSLHHLLSNVLIPLSALDHSLPSFFILSPGVHFRTSVTPHIPCSLVADVA